MEEAIKNRIILILAILSLILFIGTINSCTNAMRQKKARDVEMFTKLDCEEKLNKVSQTKTASEEKLKATEKELAQEKAAHEADKKALVQEKLVNQGLDEELQKVVGLNQVLEKNLKDALAAVEAAKAKK